MLPGAVALALSLRAIPERLPPAQQYNNSPTTEMHPTSVPDPPD